MITDDRLAQLDQLKGWLDGFRPFPPAVVAEMKKLYDVRFTYHSNAIEGNTLTQSETEMVLARGLTIGGKTLTEHLEVIGHKEGIDYIETLARNTTSITEREIKDLHALILRAIAPDEAGRYRTLDVRAAGTEHVYPSHLQLQSLMGNFIAWVNADSSLALHPIAYATEAHYRFVAIHPFRDGNGRTGRLLMNLTLLQRGYPIAVITNEQRKQYLDALVDAQNNDGNTAALLSLVIESCRASLLEYLRVLATATESCAADKPFYAELIDLLSHSN